MNEVQTEELQRPIKEVYVLLGPQIDFYWSQIAEALKEIPHYYEYYTEESTYEEIKKGHLVVWALSDGTIRGIVLTKILQFPRLKVFEICAAMGGDLITFLDKMQDVFERFAAANGCTKVSVMARPGLARILTKRFGFEERFSVLRRDVKVKRDQ